MPSDYTPNLSPHRVPDSTDAPDVPQHMRDFAARVSAHGFRTAWSEGVHAEGSPGGAVTVNDDETVVLDTVSSSTLPSSTYKPRAMAFLQGHVVVGNVGNLAGFLGIRTGTSGGTVLNRIRYHTNSNFSGLWTMSVFAMDYYNPDTTAGWNLYVSVESTPLVLRQSHLTVQMYGVTK